MGGDNKLANYIEDLWTKGFKLKDEEVQFIYFGKKFTGAPDWKVIYALKLTLQFQHTFNRSFYVSLLELLVKESIKTKREANDLLTEKGFT
ncbi:DUF6123 family protein [Aquibacillus rhizosphaerae]|uniref:DUF6123 family protein n=1 Tax=Aquibacillus rhizosphaerae TaxID=3051431 RepID=A0ABT7L2W4_9BACI|nr:DUF6123 family protein [Aquibacillus sp. LR5S19]MDL4839734.1 DUF6123 family protein [Aquibacillus sp. LR5S19]